MAEVNTGGFIHLGEIEDNRKAIRKVKRRLSRQHNIQYRKIDHCIDGVPHDEFGQSTRFKPMQIIGAQHPLLAIVKLDGTSEVLPVRRYLGTSQTKSLPGLIRTIHFFERSSARSKRRPPREAERRTEIEIDED